MHMRSSIFIGFFLLFLLGWSSPLWADDGFDGVGISKKMRLEFEMLSSQVPNNPDSVIIKAKIFLNDLPEDQKYARARLLRILGYANYFKNNDRQALEYYEQSLTIYRELNLKSGIGSVLNNMAQLCERQNDYSGAIKNYVEAALLFGEDKNDEYLGLSYVRLGNVYYLLGRNDKSLEFHTLALNLHEKTKDSLKMAYSYNNIGNVYLSIQENSKAMIYYDKAVKLAKLLGKESILPALYNNMGLASRGLEEYAKAQDYFRLAIEISRKNNNMEVRINGLVNSGSVYLLLKESDRAMVVLKEAERLVSGSSDRLLKATVAARLAQIYLNEEKYDEAITSFKDALSLSIDINSLPWLFEIYSGISEAFKGKGDYKRAYEYMVLHSAIADSSYNAKSTERLNLLRVGFESQTIERENQLLKQQSISSQLALDRLGTIRNLLIVISAIIVVFAFFLYSLYRSKNEKNILLAERNVLVERQKDELNYLYKEQYKLNETKNKFFSIVAHDLKSPFQTILGFSELLSSEYENLTEQQRIDASKNILKVSNETFRLIENLLEWGRTQTETANAIFRVFNVRELVLNTLPVFDPQLENKNLKITTELPPLLEAWADPDMIMTVIRNLVSNAIKFSPSGSEIRINTRMSQNKIYISIDDSGDGIPKEIEGSLFTFDPKVQRSGTQGEKGTGLGLALCKEFMELNDGNIVFDSELGKGSTFTIIMQSPGSAKNDDPDKTEQIL